MNSNLVVPGGSLKSKPMWLEHLRVFCDVGFFYALSDGVKPYAWAHGASCAEGYPRWAAACQVDHKTLNVVCGFSSARRAEFINVMLGCYTRIKHRDGCLALCRLRPLLRDELNCARLDHFLSIYDGRDEALAAMIPTVGVLKTTATSSRTPNYEA